MLLKWRNNQGKIAINDLDSICQVERLGALLTLYALGSEVLYTVDAALFRNVAEAEKVHDEIFRRWAAEESSAEESSFDIDDWLLEEKL